MSCKQTPITWHLMSRLPKHLFCLTADFKQYTLHKGWPEPYAYTVCDCILFWSLLGLATIVCLYLYMVNIRYFKQGNHHTHGSGQPSSLSNGISSREITIHTVLANPRHCQTVFQAGKSPYTRFWPTLVIVERYFKQGNHHTHGSGQPSSLLIVYPLDPGVKEVHLKT